MIKLFRRIRLQLLGKNKFSRYLLYAIGEIILVVIGILIALQINNWNEKRLHNLKAHTIFNQIIDELIIDVKVIQDAKEHYTHKDSLIDAYFKTDLENIKRNDANEIDENDLIDMIRNYSPIDIHDRGYRLLMDHTDNLEGQYKEYIDELVFTYQDIRSSIDFYNEQLETLLYEHRMHKIKNYSWYSKEKGTNQRLQDEFDYYKYDAIYRNFVRYYRELILNILIPIRIFEDKAIKFCRKINLDYDFKRDIDNHLSFKNAPNGILKSLNGRYLGERNDTLAFVIRDNQLFENSYDDLDFGYSADKYIKIGEMRYLGDSLFFRNAFQNLKLEKDGRISIYNLINRETQNYKRIQDD